VVYRRLPEDGPEDDEDRDREEWPQEGRQPVQLAILPFVFPPPR
jgi:hypothetical protein